MESRQFNAVDKSASPGRLGRSFRRATAPLLCIAALVCLAPCFRARAYTFIANPPYVWPNGNVSVTLKLGSAGRTLMDGSTSWDTVARQALAAWNPYLQTIQFASATQSPGVGSNGDGVNQAFFNSTVYGQSFGSGVLAVTTGWHMGTTRTEGDVTFNTAISWDSYRGPLRWPGGQLLCDLRRVATHEFGHVLGLNHPDQAGQSVSAIMNSVISDLDSLAYDDITGVEALYTAPQPPTITTQPQGQTTTAGSSVTFFVVASGAQPLSYQWRLNGADIPGATSSSYAIANVQTTDSGDYTVRVSNSLGTVYSVAATLTVQYAPVITTEPPSQTVNIGSNVTFTVVATGNPAPTYQWKLNGANISGATSSTYTRNNVQPADAGSYAVVVNNSAGSATSRTAALTVNQPPTIGLAVSTNGTTLNAPATIMVMASAGDTDGNVAQVDFYQGAALIATATTSPYNFAWTGVAAGSYSFSAIATDNLGATTTSAPVSVTVSPPTVCISPPDGLVAWWPGDGNAGDIAGNNTGVVFGGTTFVAGKSGQAFSFNGVDGYVIRTNVVATTAVDDWAMAAWFYWKGIVGTAGKVKQTLLFNGNESNNGYGIIIPEQGLCSTDASLCTEVGKLVVRYGGVSRLPTGVALDQNAWNHVALVRENSVLKLYKNGALVFSTATAYPPNPPSASDGYMTIGTAPGYAVNGLADEVMFFNSAITADQVRALFASDNFGVCKPLIFDGMTEPANGSALLNLSGQAGKSVTIFASPDLLNWLPVVTLPNPQGVMQYTDTAAGNSRTRFYKAATE